MASFTLNVPGDAPVTVDFDVPAGWKPDASGPPNSWSVPGAPMVMLTAVSPLGDEVIHSIIDVMAAGAPYTVLERAMHIHPTVSEFVPTLLGTLKSQP